MHKAFADCVWLDFNSCSRRFEGICIVSLDMRFTGGDDSTGGGADGCLGRRGGSALGRGTPGPLDPCTHEV